MRNFIKHKELFITFFCVIISLCFVMAFFKSGNFMSLIIGLGFLYPLINVYVYRFKHRNDPKEEPKKYTYLVSEDISKNIRIDIEQTKQNFGIEFECKKGDEILFKGYDAFLDKHLPARLEDCNGEIIFKYAASLKDVVKAQIPESGRNVCNGAVEDSFQNKIGRIYQTGFGKDRYYCIDYETVHFEIFMWSTGRNPHLLVFLDEKQIAQIEHANMAENYLDKYTLYLLSGYERYERILSFFTIIYDKYEYGNHGEAFYGSKTNVSFSYSLEGIGSDKYFAEFMGRNFPDVEIIDEDLTLENLKKNMEEGWETAKKTSFTKKRYEQTKKQGIIVCVIVGIIMVVICSAVHIILGIVALVICLIWFPLFFWIVKKICKY